LATHSCKNCGESFKSGISWANESYCKKCWVDGGLSKQAAAEGEAEENTAQASVVLDAGSATTEVIVRDIQMKFGSMVVFLVKWALASIPAMIILTLIALVFSAIFGGSFAGLLR